MKANYIARRAVRVAERVGQRAAGDAFGAARRVRHLKRSSKAGVDDATLARRVEAELFRGTRSPRATVTVTVVDGVVWLRGEVRRPEQIRSLERKTNALPDVRGVENLLHLPNVATPPHRPTPKPL
jgi:osmotically-inducible protein OsmY